MSRQDTDLVLEGYEEGTDPKYSDRIQDRIDDRKETTCAVNSLADQIIINNIEEEEDECMEQETEKGTTTQIEYAPKKDVPYTMSKSLSTVSSNIGVIEFEKVMIWGMRDKMFFIIHNYQSIFSLQDQVLRCLETVSQELKTCTFGVLFTRSINMIGQSIWQEMKDSIQQLW